jgi:hypothetical protein
MSLKIERELALLLESEERAPSYYYVVDSALLE